MRLKVIYRHSGLKYLSSFHLHIFAKYQLLIFFERPIVNTNNPIKYLCFLFVTKFLICFSKSLYKIIGPAISCGKKETKVKYFKKLVFLTSPSEQSIRYDICWIV